MVAENRCAAVRPAGERASDIAIREAFVRLLASTHGTRLAGKTVYVLEGKNLSRRFEAFTKGAKRDKSQTARQVLSGRETSSSNKIGCN